MAQEHFNPFQQEDFGTEPVPKEKKPGAGGQNNIALIVGAAVVICMLLFIGYYYLSQSKPKQSDQNFSSNPVVTELKSKSIVFCNYFFNLSFTTYKDSRRKAEEFFTPDELTVYKETFYDTPFTDEVINSGLETNYYYNQIIEGVLEGQAAIKVIGYIKYTSLKKNVSVEMPITAVLVWMKDTNQTWKIDNLILEM